MAIAPHDVEDHITNINLFRFKADTALVLIVTENKLLKDNYISLPPDMPDENLSEANALLAKLFVGKTLAECCDSEFMLKEEFANYKAVFVMVIDALKSYIKYDENDLIVEGEDKILQHPEYTDINKIRNFLKAVTSKDRIVNLLSEDGTRDIKINVKIGSEEHEELPADCSLVTATYSANGVQLGTYGVIGPVRMDYKKVVTVLENVGKILESIIINKG
jgi:heat-inducible transcriptional repressor